MKLLMCLWLYFIAFSSQFIAQEDSISAYKNLETSKYYAVSLSSRVVNGKGEYWANGKKISLSKYKKYESTWNNMENCCPCILQSYDEKDVLLSEAVRCTDCGVGQFTEYYPNGNVKLKGSYRENPTGNWDNIWEEGYCSIVDGEWTYFDERGDTLYSEFWNDGEFLRQVPEQAKNEIWDLELTLNGKVVDRQMLTTEEVKQLVVTPKYKNSSKPEERLTIKFKVSAIGYKENEKKFTLESFKDIDVVALLSEVGIPKGQKTSFSMEIYEGNELLWRFYPEISY